LPELAILGMVPRDPALALPERHLGLVQAGEHDDLEAFLDRAAVVVGGACDLEALAALARPTAGTRASATTLPLPPLGQRIAVALHLPGGYPELHAGRLAASRRFLAGLRAGASRGAAIYGECGGFMVLGHGLIDAGGVRHGMAGLLPATSSFAKPALHLGYRE